MPKMDGVETAKAIRAKLHENIPILVLTSYDWSEIEEEARTAGIDAFLPKPFFVSSFRHVIERIGPALPQTAQEPERETSPLEGMMFLVAEDQELNAEILSEILGMEGAQCEIASNGQEALELFQKSEPGYYDMILMDVQMPIMDGYAATRAIRASAHPMAETIPIAAMTANAFAEDVQNALAAGMNIHLTKPIDMDAMRTAIKRLQEEQRG